MIKHHPKFELLQAFVNGELPASLSVGVNIHLEMCTSCQKVVSQLTEQVAEISFEETMITADLDFSFQDMISSITEDESIDNLVEIKPENVEYKGQQYKLPTVLNNIARGKNMALGKLTRARLQFDEGEVHSSLLHIAPGGGVPEHTHKGFELTVLLEGSFTDEKGEYHKGDFIMLDKRHQHHPVSENGCLCYTVANDALHFTQGINKLLNPIGAFIY